MSKIVRNGQDGTKKVNINKRHKARRIISGFLMVVGLVLLLAATPLIWMQRTLLTTDGWVDAVGPLAEDPAVQDAVANVSVRQLTEQVNIKKWISQQLPPESQDLATPLTVLLEAGIRQLAGVITRSDIFSNLWKELNRLSYGLFLAGYREADELLDPQTGDFTIDMGTIVEQIQQALAAIGITFPLPDNFSARVTIFQSQQIPVFFTFFDTINTLTPWLALFAFFAIAGSIAIPADRRKSVFFLSIGLTVVGIILMIADAVTKSQVLNQVSPTAVFPPEAVSQAYDTVTNGLMVSLRALVLIGLLLFLGTYALGPSKSMVSARNSVRNWIHGLAHDHTPASELWIGAHRQALQVLILVLGGIVILIPAQRTAGFILIVTAIVLLLEFITEYLGRTPPKTAHG